MLNHKASFSKFKKTEIIPNIFSDHNTMRLEINYKKNKTIKKHKQVKSKQYATKLTMVIEEIKEEIKKYLETNTNKNKNKP